MIFETNKEKGRAGMALAIAYFGANGYTVSIPLNDTQWYDLIIEKNNIFQTVQCKATGSQDGTISFRSKGGTSGKEYDNIMNHSQLDYLFCLDNNGNIYNIPFQDLCNFGCSNSIKLRTEPTANHQGFQTYKYIVHI